MIPSRKQKEREIELRQERLKRQSILYWTKGKLNENGQPFTLYNHEFQRAILEDFSPVMAIQKASQIGVSTVYILKCINILERHGYNIIYTLPTLMNDVNKFVPSKVDPIIKKNGFKLDRDTTTQKQIGNGWWFFGGTFSEKEGIMTTADILIHDELDRSNLDVVDTYKSRLGHSTYRRRWYFSNPSFPSSSPDKPNVNYWWNRSDQKHWFIKCECGQGNFGGWQFLNWPESFDMEKRIFTCTNCNREITPDMRRNGQWVKKYPDRSISGYWISRMCAPWINAGDIIDEFEEAKTMAYFYNFVLGLPYLGANIEISRQIILQNLIEAQYDPSNVFMGVDVGDKNNIVIGDAKGVFRVAEGDWDTCDAFMRLHQPRMCVVDAQPETTEAKKFQQRWKGRVLRCYYKHENKNKPSQEETYKINYEDGTLSAWRTEAMDLLIDDIVNRRVMFLVNSYLDTTMPLFTGGKPLRAGQGYVEHWEALYLVKDEDTDVRSWEHSGPDHFAHATVYYWLARQVAGPKQKHKVRVQ